MPCEFAIPFRIITKVHTFDRDQSEIKEKKHKRISPQVLANQQNRNIQLSANKYIILIHLCSLRILENGYQNFYIQN